MTTIKKDAPSQPNQATEEAVRNRAIDLFIAGYGVTAISNELGRSRKWVYKTVARYQERGREGLKSRSRAPKRVHNRTAVEVEAAIVRLRRLIMSGKDSEWRYASLGAETLAWELKQAGLPAPSRRTINRILAREGLIEPRQSKKNEDKMPTDYPWPDVSQANGVHVFDFMTRTLTGGGRFYSCNLLDAKRRWPFLRIIVSKNAEAVSDFLVSAWQDIGLPTALQMDNDVVWRGSSSAPRTFSRIVRLALMVGTQVIFTPPYTPKANPLIESFNSLWASNFWSRRTFDSIVQVQAELVHFEATARYRHPWSELGGLTSAEIAPAFQPLLLPSDFSAHKGKHLPLTAGYLHFIRFLDANTTFSILNESWSLPDTRWAGKTIRTTIDLNQQQLLVFHQPTSASAPALIAQFDYHLSEDVVPLMPCFQRSQPQLWLSPA